MILLTQPKHVQTCLCTESNTDLIITLFSLVSLLQIKFSFTLFPTEVFVQISLRCSATMKSRCVHRKLSVPCQDITSNRNFQRLQNKSQNFQTLKMLGWCRGLSETKHLAVKESDNSQESQQDPWGHHLHRWWEIQVEILALGPNCKGNSHHCLISVCLEVTHQNPITSTSC